MAFVLAAKLGRAGGAARTGSLAPSAPAIAGQDDWICVRLRDLSPPPETALHTNENLTTERPTFVTHLECSMTGERYAADAIHNLSRAGKPLLVRYDLDGVKKALSKDALASAAARSVALSRAAAGAAHRKHRQSRRNDDAAGAAAGNWRKNCAAAKFW